MCSGYFCKLFVFGSLFYINMLWLATLFYCKVCVLLFETLMAETDCIILSSDSESDNEGAGGCEEMQSSTSEPQSEVKEQSGDESSAPPDLRRVRVCI